MDSIPADAGIVVVCATCKTENRANAMFCRGCAGKLPRFAASGPAAREILKALSLPTTPMPATGSRSTGLLQVESRAFWVRLGLIALALTLFVVGWYAWVTRRAAPPTPVAVIAAPAPQPAPEPAPQAAPQPVQVSTPEPVPAAEALGPGETLAAPGTPVLAPPPRKETPLREAGLPRREQPEPFGAALAPAVLAAPARAAATDPRGACAHLNFIAAARCEAALCARADYTRHPHCDAVREQTRRDIARRDLPN